MLEHEILRKAGIGFSQFSILLVESAWNNTVTEITCDSQTFFLKSYTKLESLDIELRAIARLSTMKIPIPEVVLRHERHVLFKKCGVKIDKCPTAILLHEIASLMAAIHKITMIQSESLIGISNISLQPTRILNRLKSEHGYYPNSYCLTHGDLTTDNVLLRESGGVIFIDWEESTISDPLIDLAIAIVELVCVNRPYSEWKVCMRSFEQSYFEKLDFGPLRSFYYDENNRRLIIHSAIATLIEWSEENGFTDLAKRYSSILTQMPLV